MFDAQNKQNLQLNWITIIQEDDEDKYVRSFLEIEQVAILYG